MRVLESGGAERPLLEVKLPSRRTPQISLLLQPHSGSPKGLTILFTSCMGSSLPWATWQFTSFRQHKAGTPSASCRRSKTAATGGVRYHRGPRSPRRPLQPQRRKRTYMARFDRGAEAEIVSLVVGGPPRTSLYTYHRQLPRGTKATTRVAKSQTDVNHERIFLEALVSSHAVHCLLPQAYAVLFAPLPASHARQ